MNSAMKTLYAFCAENNFQHPDMDIIKDLIKESITVRDIKLHVYDCFGISEEMGDSHIRFVRFINARQIAMSLARKYGKWALSEIGKEIGEHDHCTVMHSIKVVNNHCECEREYKLVYDKIEESLKKKFDL